MAHIPAHFVGGKRIGAPGVPHDFLFNRPKCGCDAVGVRVKRPGLLDEVHYEHNPACAEAALALAKHGEVSNG